MKNLITVFVLALLALFTLPLGGCGEEETPGADTRPSGVTYPAAVAGRAVAAAWASAFDSGGAPSQADPANGVRISPSFSEIRAEGILLRREGDVLVADLLVRDSLRGRTTTLWGLKVILEKTRVTYKKGDPIQGVALLNMIKEGDSIPTGMEVEPAEIYVEVAPGGGMSPGGFDLSGRRYRGPLALVPRPAANPAPNPAGR